jgi:hypothetical protein
MFAKTQMTGMSMNFPDVCQTPTPAGPVPVPYPNMAMNMTCVPSQIQVLTVGTPAHNLATTAPMTSGDESGVGLGVASPTVKGPQLNLTGSFTHLIKGMPATRLTSMSLGNTFNAPGATLVPSQFKVLIFSP